MSFTTACCTLPPVTSDYQPQGTEFTLGDDLLVYETKDRSPKAVLICAYDIFGLQHPNVKQFSDKLNSTGEFRVAIPDIFRGNHVSMENFPPADLSEIYKFVATWGTWERAKQDMTRLIEHYKAQGITKFATLGFCWGGKMSIRAACELEDIQGAALIHPSMLTNEDAEQAQAPILFLPTKDDADMIPLYEIVKKKLGADKTEHHRFDDMSHGFTGARGDWKDELLRTRVNEAISMVHAFFKKHVLS